MGMAFRGIDMPQLAPLDPSIAQAANAPAATPQRHGFFSRQGLGVNLLGALGDTLSTAGGGQATFIPALMKQQQQRMLMEQENQQQAAMLQRQLALEQYKRENPGPSELQQRVEYLNSHRAGEGDTYASTYAQNGGGLPQVMNVPGVGLVSIPRSTTPAGTSAPAPVTDRAAYDALPPGASYIAPDGSHRVKGGAAPTAGVPFPR